MNTSSELSDKSVPWNQIVRRGIYLLADLCSTLGSRHSPLVGDTGDRTRGLSCGRGNILYSLLLGRLDTVGLGILVHSREGQELVLVGDCVRNQRY